MSDSAIEERLKKEYFNKIYTEICLIKGKMQMFGSDIH